MDQVDVLLKGWWQKSVWERRKAQSYLVTAVQPLFQPTFRLPLIWRPREKSVERRVIIVSKSLFNRRLNVVNIFIEARQTVLKEIQVWGKFKNIIFFLSFPANCSPPALNIYNFESTDDHIMGQGGAIRKSPGAGPKLELNSHLISLKETKFRSGSGFIREETKLQHSMRRVFVWQFLFVWSFVTFFI